MVPTLALYIKCDIGSHILAMRYPWIVQVHIITYQYAYIIVRCFRTLYALVLITYAKISYVMVIGEHYLHLVVRCLYAWLGGETGQEAVGVDDYSES